MIPHRVPISPQCRTKRETEGVSGMLWANGAFLPALLLGEMFQKQEHRLDSFRFSSY